MGPQRVVSMVRWVLALAALAGIIFVYRRWLHVNPTTVALTLVLYILFLASQWKLRYSVVISIAATAAYNFYFLPPVGTFTIADPQNWLALFTFLTTSIVGSRLSQRARDEAEAARRQQRELQVLYSLSRDLLQADTVATAVEAVPALINSATRAEATVLFLLDGDRLYQSGLHPVSGVELPHFRKLALELAHAEAVAGNEVRIPLRTGVRPRGLLILQGARLSVDGFEAIGGLVTTTLDRAQAMEDSARNEANKESERLRTLILDSITHELRTPLTSIKGAASSMLADEGMSGADRRELLSVVDEEADRLNRLVGQAVEMAQIEAREVQMHFRPFALTELLEKARGECAWVSSTHRLSMEVPELPKVSADPEMMSKVLCNLLENAAKYSAAGMPILVTAELRGELVHTSVSDRGVGIDPLEQGLIFDRLYRSRTQAEGPPGTGMGLAISRAIVEAHRGTIAVTSQPGRGSVFTFTLPVARDA